jgi:hypothetical protein
MTRVLTAALFSAALAGGCEATNPTTPYQLAPGSGTQGQLESAGTPELRRRLLERCEGVDQGSSIVCKRCPQTEPNGALRWAIAPSPAKVLVVWEGPFSRNKVTDHVVLMSDCRTSSRDSGTVGIYVPGSSDGTWRTLAVGDECTTVATGATKLLVCRELLYHGDSDEHVVKVVEPATAREHVLVKARSTLMEVCDPSWQGFATDVESMKYRIVPRDNRERIDVHVRYRRGQVESLHADRACRAAVESADTRVLVERLGELRALTLSFECDESRCKAVDPSVAAKVSQEGWIELPEWR